MAVIPKTSGKDYTAWAMFRRIVAQCFEGESSNAAQAPLALNNESILAVNAAGTGTVALIKDNASDITEFPNTNGCLFDGPVTFAGGTLINLSAADALTAHAGGGQTSAFLVSNDINRFTTVATAGDSVKLPVSAPGSWVILINNTTNPMQVFGSGTDTINGVATATGISQMANSVEVYWCSVAGSWFVDIGTGFSGSLVTDCYAEGLTAHAGGGQGSATALTGNINRVTTVTTAGDSVVLPASAPGLDILVINKGANSMQVFGLGTDQIDDQTAAVGVPQMPNSFVIYACTLTGKWYSEGLATGFGGPGLMTESFANALTAHAGGGQGSATAVTTMIARFTTVATAGDSSVLPTSVAGMTITVINAAASNSMNVFPASGDTINGLGANTAYSLPAGGVVNFFCTVAGQWHSLFSPSTTTGTGSAVLSIAPTVSDVIVSNGNLQCSATLTATSNTVLANVTGLSATLTAAGTYNFRIHLNGAAGASGGLKVAIGGTATATAFNASAWNYNGTTLNALTNVTAIASALTAQTAAYTDLIVEGCIVVNAGGTFIVQAAQNASNATSTTVLVNASSMEIWRVN